MATVSVIVPTRNSARTLANCLCSIRSQRDHQVELIVVDNYSTDGTVAIAAKFADRLESHGPERSAQRNRGAELSSADYLLFIDADMRLEPTVVAECMSVITETQAAAIIIPEISVGFGFWAQCRALERSCYHGDDAVEAARFFPRATFHKVGGFDPDLIAGEDWDLSDRIALGHSLPRTKAQIIHDEGHLRIRPHLSKKRYYGSAFLAYLRKRGSTARRGHLVFRSAYLRNWKTLLRHPVLTLGMFLLKAAELAAFTAGMVAGWWQQRQARS